MRGPLAVTVNDGDGRQHVTRHVEGLRFKRTAYGGDADLTCTLQVPRRTFRGLGAGDTITVTDARSADVVFTGEVDNPGETGGAAGQRYELQAFGGAIRLRAKRAALAYAVNDLDGWARSGNSTKRADTRTDERPNGDASLQVAAPVGDPVRITWQGEWVYRGFQNAGIDLARARCDIDSGYDDDSYVGGLVDFSTPNYAMELRTGTSLTSTVARGVKPATTTANFLLAVRGIDLPPGNDIVTLRATRNNTQITGTEDHWFEFWNITMRQGLKDKYGENINDAAVYSRDHVFAHEVIRDMVGRNMAAKVDPDKVSVATTSFGIDTLAWWDGVTFADAMQDLLLFEPDLWWTCYGDALTVDLWDDTNPRYVIGERDGGITHPGEDRTLCNRILVNWTDRKGRERTTEVTADVAALDYTRDADPITLPDGTGSPANAQRVGAQALALLNHPPKAGTAVIRRPIRDLWQGCDVLPHEVMPGCTVLEAETGQTFRLTETDYSDTDAAVTCTLGTPARSIDQVMARLSRRTKRRR